MSTRRAGTAVTVGGRRPTLVDLDPGPPAGLVARGRVALEPRAVLGDLGLAAFPKTSGGKRLQLHLPLDTRATHEETTRLARLVTEWPAARHRDLVVASQTKTRRTGKVLVDRTRSPR